MKSFLRIFFVAITTVPVLYGCMNNNFTFELKTHSRLEGIASASGMSGSGSGIYVIGDNSPFLFRLNREFEILQKFPLFPGQDLPDSLFLKAVKPDLEAMASTANGGKLLIFGSGSKSPERDILVEVDLVDPPEVNSRSLTRFYDELKSRSGLSNAELNIEAAEVIGEHLLLFNRGKNLILKYNLEEFYAFLDGSPKVPDMEIFSFQLPEINGLEAGFSGATLHPDGETLIFTATVEDTGNWIDDGEVLGSFVGIITKEDLQEQLITHSTKISSGGEVLGIKVESLMVMGSKGKNRVEIALITDSDGGISEVLTGILDWK